MNNNDNHISQIFEYLAKAAATAADGVSEVMQNMGTAVGDKYDHFHLGIELGRLQAEQARLFEEIGRTQFQVKNGKFDEKKAGANGPAAVDDLLDLAQNKQDQIDEVTDKLNEYNGKVICPGCGRVCTVDDVYCSACGTKLPNKPQADAAANDPGASADAASGEASTDDKADADTDADEEKAENKKKPKAK